MVRCVAFALAGILTFAAAGCGGSGGGTPLPPTGGSTPNKRTGNVTFKIVIPNAAPAGSVKRRAFVSPSANGALVTTYAHSDTNHTTPLGTAATDISASSSACTATAGGRTCTIAVTAPAGDDDFVFILYDAAPVNGTIPSSAHELGIAGVTQSISGGTTNSVNAPIEAIVAGFGGSTQSIVEPGDGRTHAVSMVIAPTDFGDNPITAGTSNAPYANPITATVGESGGSGSGHTQLELDGGTPSATVTLTKATDTVQAVYDGGGGAGYSASVTLSAAAVNGQGGATQENLTIAPTLFVSNPTVFYSPAPAQLNTYPEGQHVLAISEPNAAAGTTYIATPDGCNSVLSAGTIVGTGTSATMLVVGGTQISNGGCSLAISDGTLTFTLTVTNTLRPAPAASPAVTEYSIGSTTGPWGIATGADGNLWFTENDGIAVSSIKPDGTDYTSHSLSADGFHSPVGATLGPDGNVWFGDYSHRLAGKVTTSAAITTYSTTNGGTLAFAAGLDGNTWFSENAGEVVGSINATSGALTEVPVPDTGIPYGVALGPDGAVWFDDSLNSVIGRISGGMVSEFPPTTTEPPVYMTAGSDGAMWFTEGDMIGRMTTSGSLTEYGPLSSIGTGAPHLAYITPGPDGALWFADCGNDAVGRITTAGTITEYVVPNPSGDPLGITVGPDGNIWFTENESGSIGVLQL